MTEPATHTTTDGDMLDEICRLYYGRTAGVTEIVLAANPHILALPLRLPAGVHIPLPQVSPPPLRPRRLWD
ncbi:MAG: tail protein X [Opitutaceae bacterium]|jgi:phage tail protein X|nr:tail protein X [Opitutaceae bacterium]